jgi:hypothetical protein
LLRLRELIVQRIDLMAVKAAMGCDMSDQPALLSREIPATLHTEAIKGLFLINGGACASMLVFLAAILKEPYNKLVPYIVVALIVFAISLAVVGWINFVRASAAVEWESVFLEGASNERAIILTQRFRLLSALSLVGFLIGVAVIAVGAARTLS